MSAVSQQQGPDNLESWDGDVWQVAQSLGRGERDAECMYALSPAVVWGPQNGFPEMQVQACKCLQIRRRQDAPRYHTACAHFRGADEAWPPLGLSRRLEAVSAGLEPELPTRFGERHVGFGDAGRARATSSWHVNVMKPK
jgi:hypothetical protein